MPEVTDLGNTWEAFPTRFTHVDAALVVDISRLDALVVTKSAKTCGASPAIPLTLAHIALVAHISLEARCVCVDLLVITDLDNTCEISPAHLTLNGSTSLLALLARVDLRVAMEFADTFKSSSKHFKLVGTAFEADTSRKALCACLDVPAFTEFANRCKASSARFVLRVFALEILCACADSLVVTELVETEEVPPANFTRNSDILLLTFLARVDLRVAMALADTRQDFKIPLHTALLELPAFVDLCLVAELADRVDLRVVTEFADTSKSSPLHFAVLFNTALPELCAFVDIRTAAELAKTLLARLALADFSLT